MSLAEEVGEVRRGHELDERKLHVFLRETVEGIGPSIAISQFKGGQSNPTFLIRSGDRRFVLRKKPPGPLLASAHMIEREYRIMRAIADTDVPVATSRVLCEDPSIIGTAFYVMDYADGRVFRDTRLPQLDARERGAIYDAMNETLAALHKVDWQALGLADFGKPDKYIQRQVARWSKQYQAAKTHAIAAMDRLMEWLPANVPSDTSTTIAHGDFRLENMIFAKDAPKVIALLDWELATLGHPLSDLAFNCMNYHLPSAMTALGGLADVEIASLGIPGEEDYVASYCRRTGRDSIPNWNYFLAFALFRCAAILQGVYARAVQKSASGESAIEVGRLAAPVAEKAWQLVSARA